ncbi:MAG: hypothetical protein WCF57_05260 [Pyrinomonadaceae bacterium]
MSDHTRALVPVNAGHFNSPDLVDGNQPIDMGLMAEALIYYDQVLFMPENQALFGEVISWFLERGLYSKFLDLLREGDLQVYCNAFRTTVYVEGEHVEPINVVEKIEQKPNCFVERFLGNEDVKRRFPKRKMLHELRDIIEGKVIEAKVDEFGLEGIENAKRDFLDPRRCTLLLQAVVDEIYRIRSLGRPPQVQATIQPISGEDGLVRVSWNIDFKELSKLIGSRLAFGHTLALSGAVIGNTYVWSAQRLGCDLYLPKPIGTIVGDKLYEASRTLSKTPAKAQGVIDQLEIEVEFPDVRRLVNEGKLKFEDVLKLRKKAKKFRHWLQKEADRDRNALYAYHFEVAKEAGLTRAGRKMLRLFGLLGGPAVGTAAATAMGQNPIAGAVAGTAAAEGLKYLFDLGSKLGEEWKPVVFGNWYKARIEKLLDENSVDTQVG